MMKKKYFSNGGIFIFFLSLSRNSLIYLLKIAMLETTLETDSSHKMFNVIHQDYWRILKLILVVTSDSLIDFLSFAVTAFDFQEGDC